MNLSDTTKRAIALGFFDGVHRGHGALLNRVREVAGEKGLVPSAVTFDAHPTSLIVGNSVPLLNTPADRADLMRRLYGIQDIIVTRFDDRMMRMDWQDFVTEYLVKENGAAHLVAGHDFHFGYKGEGNPQRLKALCAELGVGCDIIGKVEQEGITISSTYIRTLIAQGEMERADEFLGHPHMLTDRVHHGKKLGSTLGFPTVNLHFAPGVLIPARGVYATRVWFENGESRGAVTNIGVRPTVDNSENVTVEGYILDFSGDLYGQSIRMDFYCRLRGEQRFESLDALREEVMRNAQQTRDYFSITQSR
ncbi:MAG: riboflavin biosynthesis protein RibF [Clostridia bacterium]|nr:riboflavin biosynthesis protein RibF [Clostridia bacterium]